jgi:hypothetical protein
MTCVAGKDSMSNDIYPSRHMWVRVSVSASPDDGVTCPG